VADAHVVAYVGFGSNIEPESNVTRAIELLAQRCEVLATSCVFRTAALDRPADPDFLNGVVRIATKLGPRELKFVVLREIEDRLGRTRTADSYAPRTIDLDVLAYGDVAIDEDGLRLPDPDIRTRAFLAAGLVELDAELRLADSGERIADLPVMTSASGLVVDRDMTRTLKEAHYGSRQD
jgi:2-amino-4-hydroxy-6-hydroxymethyldihydropteridine diphosphokinase